MITDPNKGRLLANRYQLVKLIGKGAMGQVYQAKDMLLGGVTVAVKFLSHTLLNQKMRDRFEREATICALLGEKSNHIVRVRDYGIDENDISFYVMEYLAGGNLSEIIHTKTLSLPRFLHITRQICLGLQCAHQGIVFKGTLTPIVHRDIKPSNILVVEDSSFGELIKILDFGIAKLLQFDGSQTHSFMGTLAYCSPEQMEGKELDKRSDIYSLGVMMFEMLTGHMPILPEDHSFGSWYKAHHFSPPKSFGSINPKLKLPKSLENLIMTCIAKEVSDRPQNVGMILRALDSLNEGHDRGRYLGNRIQTILSEKPLSKATEILPVSGNDVSRRTSWPDDKPKASIVFPKIIRTTSTTFPTLWVMLTKEEIENRQVSTRYNQFLYVMVPHPMVLWITAVHNRYHGACWFPCYLDLKTNQGQNIIRLLGDTGYYRILFFAKSEPEHCANVMTSTIAPAQRQLFIDWANKSKTINLTNQPVLSKRILKQEFEKLKPKILMKLEAAHTDYPTDISG
ncbi:serine/threonine-protein kinase [Moorena sp. SIO1G6]|uniref:serine/threonine-protein kinase n=1 Tax=Moorena sp. SIO1G6 TaxID=2607840 RepID=UPI00257E7FF9|nr:serine/threonine-protein kinase [Moorena sp. SIO1G6]